MKRFYRLEYYHRLTDWYLPNRPSQIYLCLFPQSFVLDLKASFFRRVLSIFPSINRRWCIQVLNKNLSVQYFSLNTTFQPSLSYNLNASLSSFNICSVSSSSSTKNLAARWANSLKLITPLPSSSISWIIFCSSSGESWFPNMSNIWPIISTAISPLFSKSNESKMVFNTKNK